jgi:NAD(P)H-hydrate epimerase
VVTAELPANTTVTVLCGPGNNGGDGYAAARFLLGAGLSVRVVRAGALPKGPDARLEHDLCARETSVTEISTLTDAALLERALQGAGVLVDALFGIGLTRAVEEPFVTYLRTADASRARRVAADVPSGMNADTGLPMPIALRADVTAAMGLVKRGCLTEPGRALCGRVVEIDIGLPPAVHRRFLAP